MSVLERMGLVLSADLPASAKLVFGLYQDAAREDVPLRRQEVARHLRVTQMTVLRAERALEEAGFLVTIRPDHEIEGYVLFAAGDAPVGAAERVRTTAH